MADSTTTLFDIASIDAFLYHVPGASLPTDNGVWTPIAVSNSVLDSGISFLAEAFENTTTKEIVVAFRGTTGGVNLLEDLLLGTAGALSILNPILATAAAFAQAVAKANPDATITLTGHSLGGYLAQAATVNLLNSGILHPSAQASLTTVTFNAPGLPPWLLASRAFSSFPNAYNFNTQGDIVHLFGGAVPGVLSQIGQSATVAVGPTAAQEWNDAIAIFNSTAIDGTDDGDAPAAASLITHDWLDLAHPLSNFVGTNPSGQPGLFSGNPTLGAETAAQFFSLGQGIPPSPQITVSPSNVINLSDSTGDSLSIQGLPNNSGSASLTVGSGTGIGLLNPAGLQTEQTASGPGVFSTSLLQQLGSTSFAPGSSLYTAAGPTGVAIGASADGAEPGLPGQLFISSNTAGNFVYNVPIAGTSASEEIDGSGQGHVVVNGAGGISTLQGGVPVTGSPNTWVDSSGTQYVFSGAPGSATGTLIVSKGALSSNAGDFIEIQNFNVELAETSAGFLGIVLQNPLSLNPSATSGLNTPPPNFIQGQDQSYTLSVTNPSATAQSITVTLSGAIPSDFEALVGNTTEQVAANGTFNVILPAGKTNVAFTLVDTTADNGGTDIAAGANLSLSASMANPDSLIGGSIQSAPLSFLYVPTSWETDAETPPSDSIAGVGTGTVTYSGDGSDDFITTTGTTNIVAAQNSGNDSIIGNSAVNLITVGGGNSIIVGNSGTDVIVAGTGNNEIYAGSKIGLQSAIAQVGVGTPTGVKGDLIAVLDGDNTVVGGNGNDIAVAGSGSNVIVLGPGQDTFYGGLNLTQASANWNVTGGVLSPVTVYDEGYNNLFAQPYYGNTYQNIDNPSDTIASAANDTVFGGNGNDLFVLGNGNNDVEVGNGNSTVQNGMGNDTVIAGTGADLIEGGGGTEYIEGGSGADTIYGGDGNNTVIGGSGNSTIYASVGPGGINTRFANDTLVQNYVTGGSGNDLIYGSAGADTLIAGTGNSTIVGGLGTENIVGGSGNDWLQGGSGNTTIAAGGSGIDTLLAAGSSSSASVIYGGNGRDLIQGGSGSNVLYAGDGGTAGLATTVLASPFDSSATTTIYGGLGVDLLEGGTGSDVIYAGDGGSAAAFTTLLGGTGNETLYGGLGTDFVQGGSGTDQLFAGDGGTAAAPETVSGGTGVATLTGGAGPSLLQDLESGSDLIIAGTSNDTLIGIGSDTLVAGPGNDGLQANSGSVTFDFNAGFADDNAVSAGGTENIVFGTGIEATDLSGFVNVDLSGNTYLDLSGDGGSVSVEGALTGTLNSVDFADTGPIALPTLMTDAFGGDSIFSAGSNFIVVAVTNNESVAALGGNDTISAWGSGETITGATIGGFADHIYSDGSGASIKSVNGGDAINAAGANDSITGGSSLVDHITVSGASSKVTSTTASDVITASGTADTLVGGSGNSTYFINNATDIVQASVGGGVDTIFASVSYTAPTNVNVLTLVGSANIAATGNAGSDTLTGGAGVDTLIAGAGAATLVGGSGNTTFVVNSASDLVQDSSATANNTVQSSLNYALPTNVNNLVLTGTAALTGTANAANDTLTSNSGVDTLIGGVGNDTFILNNPNDVVQDTAGTATIVYQLAMNFTLPINVNILTLTGTSSLQATGNAANDLITANAGADTLVAGNGTDTLVSGSGVNSLVGGTGNDLFVVNNASDVVIVGGTHGADTIQSSVSFTASPNVATLTLVGSANATATGNSLANLLTGNSGNDTLTAGSGIATLVGGAGNDTFVVNSTSDVVQDSIIGANNTIQSSVSFTLAANVNSLVLTGTAALTGTANSGADTLTANSGADTLIGGSGNDTFIISNAADVVQDTSGTATNAILSSVNFTLPTDVNALTLTGTAALMATGNAGPDLISANSGADTLIAASAGDTLVSGSGVDSLVGSAVGLDLFILNNALDSVSSSATNPDTIQSAVSFTLPTNVTNLTLTGTANLVGSAISGSNFITGNAGSDTLKAGSGNDTLSAGSGIDTLIGGSGTDTFVINNAADVLQGIAGVSDQVYSSVSYTMAASLAGLTLTGTANLVGTENNTAGFMKANFGNDTLISGSGITQLFGSLGADVFVVNNSSDQITEQFSKAAIDTVESSVSYTMSNLGSALQGNVLELTGSGNLVGTDNGNAALVVGNAGLDTLIAGGNEDTLTAGSGLATLIGGNGNNTFVINNASDVIQDTLTGHNNVLMSSVTYTLPTNVNTLQLTGTAALVATANSANDSLRGNAGADTLVAGTGSDTLVAGAGLATLKGGTGSDTFVVNNSADVIQSASTSGSNLLISSVSYTLPTNINVLTLTGIASINGVGNSAADSLTAGAGQDTLTAGAGVATLIGGTGNDTFVVNNTNDVVQDSSATTSNTIQSSVNYSLVANVNTLILSGTAALQGTANSANDTLVSNAGVDTLVGSTGNDTFVINNSGDVVQDTSTSAINTAQSSVNYTLVANVNTLVLEGTAALVGTANGGADTLVSNTGVDTLVGGAGNDTFVVNNALDVVQDTSATTSNAIQSSVNYTLPMNVSALTLTGSAALTATGNAASNVLTANSGNDTLFAGSGVATLVGGADNNTFVVNSVSDVVVDSTPAASNAIQSSVSFALAANVNDLQLTGTAALVGTANSGNDTLVSDSGVDTLVGGSGHDLFIINNAADVIQNATSNDTVESSVSYSLPANITSLILVGSANIQGTGNASADILTAGAGVDTLVAGTGIATMNGGAGNDTFVVNNVNDVVRVSSTTTSNSIQSSVNYSLPANVDTLTFTGLGALIGTGNGDSNNILNANGGADSLTGLAFNNTINGGAGIDTINAGPGQNVINSGNGGSSQFSPMIVVGNASGTSVLTSSTIYGGAGFDSLTGGPGSDLIYGGSGDDTVVGGSGVEVLYAGSGGTVGIPTQVNSGSGFDTLIGGAGYNILADGGPAFGNDSIVAGSGADTLFGKGHDTLEAGNGSDLIEVQNGNQATLQLNAGLTSVRINQLGGNDNLIFGTGLSAAADTIMPSWDTLGGQTGQFGLDIIGPTGSVSVDGGLNPATGVSTTGSINSVDFIDSGSMSLTQFVEAAHSAPATVTGGGSGVIFNPVNNAVANSGTNGYNVYGFGSNQVLFAGSNVGTLYAYGNDSELFASTLGGGTLVALGLADTLFGPSSPTGMNFLVNDASDVILQGAPDGGNDHVASSVSYTLPTNVTNLGFTGSANIVGTGNNGNSVLTGNSGNDTLIAGTGNATIQAGTGNQLLEGGSGSSNRLTSGVGNDTLVAGTGAATLVGLQGTDVFIINSASDVISSVPTTAHDTVESSVTFDGSLGETTIILTGTANIEATSTVNNTTLIGGAGNDTLDFGSVDIGGSGTTYMESASTMIGGTGPDDFYVFNPGDLIQNGKSTDTVNAGLVNAGSVYTLPAGIATLVLQPRLSNVGVGNSLNDTLVAAAGDTLVAGSGLATMIGGGGADVYVINNGGDVIQNGASTDTIESSLSYTLPSTINALILTGSGNLSGVATAGNNQIVGNSGNDILTGGTGSDTLVAGSGNDTLLGNGSNDTFVLNAGFGQDLIQANQSGDVIQFGAGIAETDLTYTAIVNSGGGSSLVIAGDGGSVTVQGGLVPGTITSVNFNGGGPFTVPQLVLPTGRETVTSSGGNLILTSNVGDTVTGGGGQDTIIAWGNSDTLQAGSGGSIMYAAGNTDKVTGGASNDSLTASGSNDTLSGGSGNEVFFVNSATTQIQVTAGVGHDTVYTSVNYTVPTNITALTLTGSAALVATANAGNDSIVGNAGADSFHDGGGADTFVGGSGNAVFFINSTTDVVQDSFASAINTISSTVSYTLPTNVNVLAFTGTAPLKGTANAGNDTLTANTGPDTLVGGSGNDTFVISNSGDVLQDTSTTAVNTVQSLISYSLVSNVNTLVLTGTAALSGTANAGADTLTSNTGADTLIGGAGNDTFIVNNALDIVQDTSTTTTNTIVASVGYTLPSHVNVLTLTGSFVQGTGNSGSDVMTANGFSDTLVAGSGVATLIGGVGNDTFEVNNGSDVVQDTSATASNTILSSVSYTLPTDVNALIFSGTAALQGTANGGNDTLTANTGADTLVAGTTGTDSLVGGSGNDTFVVNNTTDIVADTSTTADNTISSTVSYTLPTNVNALIFTGTAALQGTGNSASDSLTANSGADTLTAGSGVATLTGGAGNDTFVVNSGLDIVQDTSTTTTNTILTSLSYTLPTNVNVLTLSGTAALQGTGNSGSDVLTANSGADTLIAGSGVATLIGGVGDDTFVVNNSSDVVQDIWATASNTLSSNVNYTLPTNINALIFTGTSALRGTGNAGNDLLTANTGSDTLVAGSGVDTLVAGTTGTDSLVGGSGNDTFVIDNSADIVTDTSTTTSNTISSTVSYTLPTNVNALIFTGTAALQGTGNAGNDSLTANTGSDTLVAGSGSDTLVAGTTGTDSLVGGSGNDTFVIDNAADIVTDSSGTASNTISSTVSFTLPTHVNALNFTGTAALQGTGNAGNDSLTANTGSDTLIAGSGSDTLVAGTTGTDSLVGGSGNDTFVIDNAADIVTDTSGTASNTISSTVSYTLPTDVNSLIFTGTAALQGTGNAGNDSLTANTGNDTLIAGSGTDTLVAGATGTDSLVGGSGNDTFVIDNSADIVTDASTTTSNTILSTVSYTLTSHVNALVFTGTAALQGTGNSGSDSLTANSGADTLTAGSGVATLIGGAGNDTFVINNTGDVVTDTSTTASNAILSSVSYTLPTNVNSLTLTGASALQGTGNSGSDAITANTSGNDTLIAGSGVATLIGGLGNDTFVVNNGGDIVQDTSTTASNTISSTVSYTLPTNVNTLTFTGTAALQGTANGATDTLTANGGADTLVAATTGTDHLIGGAGNDTFLVNNTADTVADTSTTAINTIVSTVTYALPTDVNVMILTGTAALQGTGNTGSDTLTANSGADTLAAGSGVATLIGGSGNNVFVLNNVGDVVTDTSSTANNTISSTVSYTLPTNVNSLIFTGATALKGTGNAANDQLTANTGSDTLVAGSGTDTLIAGTAGTDSLVGGAGNDTFLVNNAADIVTDTSSTASNTILSTVTYSLPTDVNVMILTGTAALKATGNAANDSLTANSGADTLVAGTGLATLIGGAGNDIFVIDNTGDVVTDTSSSAINTISSTVTYTLPTNVNALTFTGTAALVGTANGGNDTLTANTGADTFVGGSGNDFFVIGSASDVVQDTSSTSSNTISSAVSYTLPSNVNNLIFTGASALQGTGNAGSNVMTANSGADTLTAGSGVATLIGGAGNDTFVLNSGGDIVTDSSSTASNTISSTASYTLPTNVNALLFTGTAALTGTANSGNDTLTANSGADTLVGGAGNDTFVVNSASDVVTDTSSTTSNKISSTASYTLPTNVNALLFTGTAALIGTANSGNDTLTANTGADTLVGGSGNDTFVVSTASDVVTDTSTTATNTISSTVSYTLPTNVNALFFTGAAALSGKGNAGNDTLTANTGADTLTAGSGLATLVGGSGNDTFVINNVADLVQDTSTSASNTISSSVSYTLPTNVNTLVFTGVTALTGTANSANDTLTANTGADTLVGGAGNDTFVVNSASDVVTDTSTTASNTISSTASYTLPSNVNALIFTGAAALTGTANSANDTLTANSGADTLIGGSGNDTFVLSSASDVVTDTSTTASNTISSTVSYTLPTNVNSLVFTGASALKGTANNGNDTLTSNTGADTLVGGAGNELFIVNNSSDVVTDTSATANNTISSTVSYTLPTDVNALILTGTAALKGTGNGANDTLTANSGADTLTAGSGVATIIGGAGNDTFVVDSASDVIQDTSTAASNTISSTVSYTLAANVNSLIFTGTAALIGTANSANDTLTANTGADTLVGGAGNDTFVVNSASDVVQDTSTTTSNTISSTASYTLPTNVNTLIFTGTAALIGTANTGNDTLTANTGADTLVGGSGNDTFVVSSASDVVTDTSTTATNTISSTVSYTLPTNVNALTFTGATALIGTANAGNDVLTANTGSDTLVAGSGTDTLIAGTTGTDSLVGGTGSATFLVNNAADVVSVATSTGNDTVQSSVSYTLPTNVQYLTLSGTSALTGTGNSLTDLIIGNTGADTLVGGTGIAVLEGGRTAGSDQIKALSNQAALIGGAAASTLTGGAFKDFFAAGTVSDSITTGATTNVVSVNKGDGATALQPTTSATNVLSLGAGIDTESLFFTKTGNNLILTDGVSGDSITFTNWYAGAADQDYTTLQVVEIASANYNSGGSDGLRNKALEAFNFTALVAAYNAAGSPANWALSTAMPTTQLTSTSTADYGGDLAYYFGLNGSLTGMDLSAAQSTLTNASFGTATQTIDAFSGISGGGGLHLSVAPPAPQRTITPVRQPQILDGEDLDSEIFVQRGIQLRPSEGSLTTSGAFLQAAVSGASIEPTLRLPEAGTLLEGFDTDANTQLFTSRVIASGNFPQLRAGVSPAVSSIQIPAVSQAMNASPSAESSSALNGAGQISSATSFVASADATNFVLQLTSDDDFLRAIRPRLSSPIRLGVAPATSSIEAPALSTAMSVASSTDALGTPEVSDLLAISESQDPAATLSASDSSLQRVIAPGRFPQLLDYAGPTSANSLINSIQPSLATPRIGSTVTSVSISDIESMLGSLETRAVTNPQISINGSQGLPKNLVDPINVAWLTMHNALDQSSQLTMGGSEASPDQNVGGANDALVGGAPIDRIQRLPDELELHSQQMRQRAM